jgi:hypothetical protein
LFLGRWPFHSEQAILYPKWVVSRSLKSVGPNATLVANDVEAVRMEMVGYARTPCPLRACGRERANPPYRLTELSRGRVAAAIEPHGLAALAGAVVGHAGGAPGWRYDLAARSSV